MRGSRHIDTKAYSRTGLNDFDESMIGTAVKGAGVLHFTNRFSSICGQQASGQNTVHASGYSQGECFPFAESTHLQMRRFQVFRGGHI